MAGKVVDIAAQRSEQARASDPRAFVWVAANAGAGKTHVLVERLMRLMLAGTPPTRILCLTFTNAAAAEMANRLFARLSAWAIASDADLSTEVARLTESAPTPDLLARARRLFPLALESPGGLKIHTIHAFCERVLHRFPLEAGVSPHFSVLDERGGRDLIDEARETVMAEAAGLPRQAPLVGALDTVSALAHDMSLGELLGELVRRRRAFAALEIDDEVHFQAVIAWLGAELGVDPDTDETSFIGAEFGDGDVNAGQWTGAAEALAGGSKRDQQRAPLIDAIVRAPSPQARYRAHQAVFLTKSGAVTAESQLMTQAVAQTHPAAHEFLLGERERAERVRTAIAGIATLAATQALLVLGRAVIGEYERAKADRGLLDYDDLILRTRALLANAEDALWVLYKLDGGIDHILVDEAQDTSPDQWAIVRNLAEDMLAGETARYDVTRSVFAVGDEKQSIFSFQGADPAKFAEMRGYFEQRTGAAGHAWDTVPLTRSFRSAPEILAAVDAVFADTGVAAALAADGLPPRHEAHRTEPGRIEIWPTIAPEKSARPDPWTAPLDYVGPGDPKIVLARKIAAEIAGWLAEGRSLGPDRPAIRPGDIMILVRRRNAFVDAVVRELKSHSVPVAGVDRMRLAAQIVVQDLMALGRFVLMPDDDLSLAELVKSPLVGLDEDDLFAIAYGRPASLWRALDAEASNQATIGLARERLGRWLAMADQMPPFEFFTRVLAEDGTRRRIAARLGPEAADPIEEFVAAALAFESDHPPSLDGFLAWLGHGDTEIKRDMDHGRDEVRVMTVHGAKGLEASVVILPDTCEVPRGPRGIRLVDVPFPALIDPEPVHVPVWPRRGGGEAGIVAETVERARRGAADEYLRLLYVAMTRARDWLIVTGYETTRGRAPDSWYDVIRSGLDGQLSAYTTDDGETRWCFGGDLATSSSADIGASSVAPASVGLPDWVAKPPPPGAAPPSILAPSRAGRAIAQADILSPLAEAHGRRFSRGLAVHALIERLAHLPAGERREAGLRYLATFASDFDQATSEALCEEAVKVIELPEFAPFLAPGARAEAAFVADLELADGRTVTVDGRVDWLAVGVHTVHVVDFKTHRPAPRTLGKVARAHLVQMAYYRAALAVIFAPRNVEASLLWTDEARLMALPGRLLDDVFHAAVSAGEAPPA